MGANLGTACEGALKFGETISIPSFAYETEEYIHDPNIQMTPAYSVFLIDGGETHAQTALSVAQEFGVDHIPIFGIRSMRERRSSPGMST